MFDFLKNAFLNRGRYKTHSEAVIVSCFYNPQNSPYRLMAFQKWYRSIKHLNYRVIECLIGPDATSQLPNDPNIIQVRTESVLWHKETLLNKVIADLPEQFKYVFWLDADVLFTNDNWLVDSVRELQSGSNIVQPFEYCVHLERNQLKPEFDVELAKKTSALTNKELDNKKRLWRSFCANIVDLHFHWAFETVLHGMSENYDEHGHVGFAWGARREVLEACPLFDRALIGGADHIIAHAAAGQIPHPCITKGFGDNIDEVLEWSDRFYDVVQGRIGYAPGNLYHIWHGDIAARQYLKRIKDFTDETTKIKERDENGLHVAGRRDQYVRRYFQDREVTHEEGHEYDGFDDGFYEDMGYMIADIVFMFGEPQYYDDPEQTVPSDFKPSDFKPFDQGGAGLPDDGSHVITDEMLEGAIISDGMAQTAATAAGVVIAEQAMQAEAPDPNDLQAEAPDDTQPEFTPAEALDPNEDGNFS